MKKRRIVLALGLVAGVGIAGLFAGYVWRRDVRQLIAETVLVDLAPPWMRSRLDHEAWIPTAHFADGGSAQEVFGYTNVHSVPAGDSFELMLSTPPWIENASGHIELRRLGANGPLGELAFKSKPLAVGRQEITATAATVGVNWKSSLTMQTTGASSGYYSIDFVSSEGGRTQEVAFLVVTNPDLSGDVLIKLSTNTYQAYNQWGGHSFYASRWAGVYGEMVSFDRPTRSQFRYWAYDFARWIEPLAKKHGFRVDYASDHDAHRDPRFTETYPLLISIGHDEYWTGDEFRNLHKRTFEHGKNTLFLSANTGYWLVRPVDVNRLPADPPAGRQMICYKRDPEDRRFAQGAEDPLKARGSAARPLYSGRFRDDGRYPETMLRGVATKGWFAKENLEPFRVFRTDLPFFKGLGYRKGDLLANVVGYEWDTSDPEGDGARLWHPHKSLIDAIPKDDLKVVFEGDPVDGLGQQSRVEAVYFESAAGAKVFSSGTIRWAWGLNHEGFEDAKFRRLNEQLVLYMLNRPF